MSPLRRSLLLAAVIIGFDQLTKWWVVSTLPGKPITLIDGFLEFRYILNSGASFSMLQGAGSVIALLVVAIIVFMVLLARKLETNAEAIALGLVLGGAVGNLLDRIFRGPGLLDGPVVDFINFSFFPAFNVADSAISIGAVLVLLFALFRK